jgi:hypothetical protein
MAVVRPNFVSRKLIVAIVALCMAVAALVIPVAAHLPRWIEIELVLGAWWLLWVITLVVLLFQGVAVDDDTSAPTFARGSTKGLGGAVGETASNLEWFDGCGFAACGEGCLIAAGILLAVFALLAVIEFLIPAIAILLFASIGGMLARAVNDRHECEGRFGLSVLWGLLWATLYTGPVIAIVAWVSAFLAHRR